MVSNASTKSQLFKQLMQSVLQWNTQGKPDIVPYLAQGRQHMCSISPVCGSRCIMGPAAGACRSAEPPLHVCVGMFAQKYLWSTFMCMIVCACVYLFSYSIWRLLGNDETMMNNIYTFYASVEGVLLCFSGKLDVSSSPYPSSGWTNQFESCVQL